MPLRPDLRHLYCTPEWQAARERHLMRTGGRCEGCGKPDRTSVLTRTGAGHMFWRFPNRPVWFNERGWPCSIEDYQVLVDR